MPLVTITVRKPKPSTFKTAVLDAIHTALVSSGVPINDKFQRVLELDADDFRFDANYPDLSSERNSDFILQRAIAVFRLPVDRTPNPTST